MLAACGKGGSGEAKATTTQPESLALAQFFGGAMFVAGKPLRAPFGVADQDGLLPTARTPERLTVQLYDPSGTIHGDPIEVARRSTSLPRAYFPLLATVQEPGIYTARTKINGKAAEMSLQVDRPIDVKVIQVGSKMAPLQTPTTADAHGVTPICTRDPVCALHEISVADALAKRAPIALLVASPAFCQMAICGPVLEVLLDVRAKHPGVHFLHGEVYADPAKDQQTYAPVVDDLGLHFEPCLVLVGSDGTIADRIDTIFDESELDERLAQLT